MTAELHAGLTALLTRATNARVDADRELQMRTGTPEQVSTLIEQRNRATRLDDAIRTIIDLDEVTL